MAKRRTIQSKDSDEERPKLLDIDVFIGFANEDDDYTPPRHIPPDNALASKNLSDDRRNDTSQVPKARDNLTKLLDGIISNQKITDSEELQYFVNVVELHVPEYQVENGQLIEGWVYGKHKTWLMPYPPFWLQKLAFNIIWYLSDSKNDLRKVKNCVICKKYFISRTIKRPFCYEGDCENSYKRDYHKKDMNERRDPGSDKFNIKYI